eukprot:gene4483-3276_t
MKFVAVAFLLFSFCICNFVLIQGEDYFYSPVREWSNRDPTRMSSDTDEYEPSEVQVAPTDARPTASSSVSASCDTNAKPPESVPPPFPLPDVPTVEEPQGGIRLRGIKGRVMALCLTPNGSILCAGGEDGRLCMWDFDHPPDSRRVAPTRILTPFVNRIAGLQPIVAVHAALDGSYFVVCQDGDRPALVGSGGAQMGFCATGERGMMDVVQCKGHRLPVTHSATHGIDPKKFYTCSQDGTARLWDQTVFTLRSCYAVKHGTGQLDDTIIVEAVCGLSTVGSGHSFATGGDDGKVQLWDTRSKYRPGASSKIWNIYGDACMTSCGDTWANASERHVGGMTESASGIPALIVRAGDALYTLDARRQGILQRLQLPPLSFVTDTSTIVCGDTPRSFLTGTSARGFNRVTGGHVVEVQFSTEELTSDRMAFKAWQAGRADEDVMSIASYRGCTGGALFAGLNSGDVIVRPATAAARSSCPFTRWWDRRPLSNAAAEAEAQKTYLRELGAKSSRFDDLPRMLPQWERYIRCRLHAGESPGHTCCVTHPYILRVNESSLSLPFHWIFNSPERPIMTLMMTAAASPAELQHPEEDRPTFEEISFFMAKHAGKLAQHPLCGVAPYEYSGRDYAMVLYGCSPSSIDMSQLSWTATPLAAQRTANLNLFCQSALQLRGADTPISSLHASLLQPSAANLRHHIKVQHWLFLFSRRHPPSSDFDPSLVRLQHRQQQLGEPFAFQRDDPPHVPQCTSLRSLKAFEPLVLSLCAPYTTALQVFSRTFKRATTSPLRENMENPSTESSTEKTKPWLSYSKPWRNPSVLAEKTKKAKEEGMIKKRLEAARRTGSGHRSAVLEPSLTVAAQLARSTQEAQQLRYILVEARRRASASILVEITCTTSTVTRTYLRSTAVVHRHVKSHISPLHHLSYLFHCCCCATFTAIYAPRPCCLPIASLLFSFVAAGHPESTDDTGQKRKETEKPRQKRVVVVLLRRNSRIVMRFRFLTGGRRLNPHFVCPSITTCRTMTSAKGGDGTALLQSTWLRRHPVEKLMLLRTVAERAPTLVDEKQCPDTLSSLGDIQDTMARLQMPYAPSERHRHALITLPFPCTLRERWTDPFSSVALKLHSSSNPTGEQVPPPHTWDPESTVEADDGDGEAQYIEIPTIHGTRGHGGTVAQRLQRVQQLTPKMSDNDVDLSSQLLRRRRKGYRTGVDHLSDSARGLPLVSFETEQDEVYHGNAMRGECCPLNDLGTATPVPIHIPVGPSAEELTTGCVKAHAAVLSALFIEGRAARLTSNTVTIVEYVRWTFHELITAGVVSCSLTDESFPHYFPSWCTREVAVLLPPQKAVFTLKEVKRLSSTILQSVLCSTAPLTIAVEAATNEGVPLYAQEVKKMLNNMLTAVYADANPESRVQWLHMPARGGKGRKEVLVEGIRLYSQHLYAVQLLYLENNSLLDDRAIQSMVLHDLSSNTRVVGINCSVWHVLLYFPQVPFLAKKIGNAFRYRAVERSVIHRRFQVSVWSNPIASLFSVLPWTSTRGAFPVFHALPIMPCRELGGAADGQHSMPTVDLKKNYLLCERLVDYLASPSRITLLALYSARILGLRSVWFSNRYHNKQPPVAHLTLIHATPISAVLPFLQRLQYRRCLVLLLLCASFGSVFLPTKFTHSASPDKGLCINLQLLRSQD